MALFLHLEALKVWCKPIVLFQHLRDVGLPDVVLAAHDLLEAALRYEAHLVLVKRAEEDGMVILVSVHWMSVWSLT